VQPACPEPAPLALLLPEDVPLRLRPERKMGRGVQPEAEDDAVRASRQRIDGALPACVVIAAVYDA
jgi:hypothetical protein